MQAELRLHARPPVRGKQRQTAIMAAKLLDAAMTAIAPQVDVTFADIVDETHALREENLQLKEANAKLLSELNAFDLDFFEEIEDLKFRYHETKKENERLKAENRRLR